MAYNYSTRSRSNSFRHPPQPAAGRQHPPPPPNARTYYLDSDSEESLYLPIQHPSPIKPSPPPHLFSQVKRKPVPGRQDSATLPADAFPIARAARRDSDTLGTHDPFYHRPAETLKASRVDLLRHKLVPQIYSPHAYVSNGSQEKINGIILRCEPDRSIRGPVSPDGHAQASLYQQPAEIPWLQQSLDNPQAGLQQVRSEQKVRRANHVPKRVEQPRQRLLERQKTTARGEYTVLRDIQRERAQLQHTQMRLNGRNELGGYSEPLLDSRESEPSVADMFDRESQARQNGARRPLPQQKLRKQGPEAYAKTVEGRSGLIAQKATVVQQQQQQEVSGWFEPDRRRDRVWKKCKTVVGRVLRPKRF